MGQCLVSHDFIIAVFCPKGYRFAYCVDDLWNQITQGRTVRQRGFSPSLSEARSNYNGNCWRIFEN